MIFATFFFSFPTLTWSMAKSVDASKLLVKHLKIKNTGGKQFSCRIVRQIAPPQEDFGEWGEEEKDLPSGSLSTLENHLERITIKTEYTETEETEGELHWGLKEEATSLSGELLDELIGNIFLTFRFSEKYHIVVPPFSTKSIQVRFTPEYKGFHQEIHAIQFDDCFNCQEVYY